MSEMLAPFPYFGGKRTIAADIWRRLGNPKQYIEPFCGSAAVLLAKPQPASLEVIGDGSGFIANFWRAVKHQPELVAFWTDYPVSHVDLGARHVWLMERRAHIASGLQDCEWPGDEKVAGWWLWGQCCWIGSGWCQWDGKVPHAGDAGQGVQAIGQVPHAGNADYLTSAGQTAHRWLRMLSERLERVRIVHGDWSRCLNNHYGGPETAVFLDPPYRRFETMYGSIRSVADEAAAWARDNEDLRIALCGLAGDYEMPGWEAVQWDRGRLTYGGGITTDQECVWYSPVCLSAVQPDLFHSERTHETVGMMM